MNLLEQTKSLLSHYKISPKKSLGQHFMVNSKIFDNMLSYASLNCNDVVLDIGAGFGFLTHFLSKKCKKVIAVEVDPTIIDILRKTFRSASNISIVEGDILKVDLPHFDKVISFPPYNISSDLILWFFSKKFHSAILVFQKDFAIRFNARVNSEEYGWLSVLTHYNMEVKILKEIPRKMFYPVPKVDSVIVGFRPKQPPHFPIADSLLFTKFVKCLFTERNKKVRKAILPFIKQFDHSLLRKVKEGSVPFQMQRVRTLTPQNFGELANVLLA
jgi:16S rRNA (adenine1518-N6/adenine1519-N6)-dimethyltransferase